MIFWLSGKKGFYIFDLTAYLFRIHGHGLLRYPEGAIFHPGELIQSAWAERYGFAKVEIPRSQDDVTGYCIKYATKNLLQDTYLIL